LTKVDGEAVEFGQVAEPGAQGFFDDEVHCEEPGVRVTTCSPVMLAGWLTSVTR
jgi:hypothetical protein